MNLDKVDRMKSLESSDSSAYSMEDLLPYHGMVLNNRLLFQSLYHKSKSSKGLAKDGQTYYDPSLNEVYAKWEEDLSTKYDALQLEDGPSLNPFIGLGPTNNARHTANSYAPDPCWRSLFLSSQAGL